MKLIRFTGASMREDDAGNREYTERGPIWVNPEKVCGVYDHTILTAINKIRVMETADEIVARLMR